MARRAEDLLREARPVSGVRVVADIGGTNARFATVGATAHDLERIEILRCADYPTIQDAIAAYRTMHRLERIERIGLAVAGPVDQEMADLPNNPWTFNRYALQQELEAELTLINDFAAQAMCVDALRPAELAWIGLPRPREPGMRTVLGPGTGLGVALQTPDGAVVPSEGGHVGFAPTNQHEIELLQCLLPRYRRVSAERLLSGPGLENLFWANQQIRGPRSATTAERRTAPEIAALAAEGDALALEAVGDFLDILASFAGDLALFTWSTGGVYLSGGALRGLTPFLDGERFRARFEDKGRFTRFCEGVPVACIDHPLPGLLGCAAALEKAGWGAERDAGLNAASA